MENFLSNQEPIVITAMEVWAALIGLGIGVLALGIPAFIVNECRKAGIIQD